MRQIKVNKEAFTPRVTKASALYLNEVDRTKVMDPQKEAEIAFLAYNGDEEARLKLINANLRFVLTVAKNYAKDPENFAEIVAAGNVGLVEAASIFDPSRGFRFISFAPPFITNAYTSKMDYRIYTAERFNINETSLGIPLNLI